MVFSDFHICTSMVPESPIRVSAGVCQCQPTAAPGSTFRYCTEGPLAGSPETDMVCTPAMPGSDHLPWSVFQYLAPAAAGFAVGFDSCAQAAASRQLAINNATLLISPPRDS